MRDGLFLRLALPGPVPSPSSIPPPDPFWARRRSTNEHSVWTGSECFGLKWIDFDLENRTVRIERQFREGRLIDRTKKNKVRLVDLSREVVKEFRAHRN